MKALACNTDANYNTIGSEDVNKDDQTGNQSINPEEMPEEYCFSSMNAFFLWGCIIEEPN